MVCCDVGCVLTVARNLVPSSSKVITAWPSKMISTTRDIPDGWKVRQYRRSACSLTLTVDTVRWRQLSTHQFSISTDRCWIKYTSNGFVQRHSCVPAFNSKCSLSTYNSWKPLLQDNTTLVSKFLSTQRSLILLSVISGFHREVDENCALLSHYAANGGNLLPTFRYNL